ncbi:MAG: VWA domain-containing protein [Nannocystaceae bacterium]
MLRSLFIPRIALLAAVAGGLPSLFACLQHPLKPVELEIAREDERMIDLTVNRDVDILFVMDNSGSMGDEQGLLARNFGTFIDVLEDPEVAANYRIGVTTTDSGNPACKTTGAEAGKLQMRSCRERTEQFVFDPGGINQNDQTDVACLDNCPNRDLEILPSFAEDGETKPRKWLENQEGALNIDADEWTTTEAFQCLGPMGINGCGFESQLESMYKALRLTEYEGSDSFKFVRRNAILAVVIITDELDCSYNPDHGDIFTDDNTTFWLDPNDGPRSGICWEAGVECSGGGSPYDECHSANLDDDGDEVDEGDAGKDAVLHPISRYINLLQGYENEKNEQNSQGQEVIVSVLGGVPHGYPAGDEPLNYFEETDETQAIQFGVVPGCLSQGGGRAYPPVRLREWAEAFEIGGKINLFSICSDDYAPALKAIADAIIEQITPACFRRCAKEMDVAKDGLQTDCTISEQAPGSDPRNLVECERDGDDEYEWEDENYVVPEGEEACYAVLSDKDDGKSDTDDRHDDMETVCREEGWNLQFKLRRKPGSPGAPGTTVRATCQLSDMPEVDCPDI